VTYGGTATGIARDATKEIPIIFIWGLSDPVRMGFVKSLARPQDEYYRVELFAESRSFRQARGVVQGGGSTPATSRPTLQC